ncbi:MAG: hypothetical protein ACJ78Z_12230 [Myxococcales bacterium]
MIGSAFGETMNLLWGPGVVFLLVLIWLIRRVIRAARTESQLEEERLREWMKAEVAQLQSSKAEPRLMRVPTAAEREKTLAAARQAVAPSAETTPVAPPPLEGTLAQGPPIVVPDDVNGVTASELDVIRPLFRADGALQPRILWVRSTGSHIAFCERRDPTPPSTLVRDVITVVKIAGGKVVGKWQFG